MRIANDMLEHPTFVELYSPGSTKDRWSAVFHAPYSKGLKVGADGGKSGDRRIIQADTLHDLIGKAAEFLRVWDAECGPPKTPMAA